MIPSPNILSSNSLLRSTSCTRAWFKRAPHRNTLGIPCNHYTWSLSMLAKHFTKLFTITCLLVVLGLGLMLLEEGEPIVSINGVVCNHSSISIWLTMSKGERHSIYSLPSGQCTNFFKQDAEAIWGKDCRTDPCQYQAWKVSAGRFEVYNTEDLSLDSVLRIEGWGASSRWHVSED